MHPCVQPSRQQQPTHLCHAAGRVGAGEEGGLRQAPAGHQQVSAGIQAAQQEVANEGDVLAPRSLCRGGERREWAGDRQSRSVGQRGGECEEQPAGSGRWPAARATQTAASGALPCCSRPCCPCLAPHLPCPPAQPCPPRWHGWSAAAAGLQGPLPAQSTAAPPPAGRWPAPARPAGSTWPRCLQASKTDRQTDRQQSAMRRPPRGLSLVRSGRSSHTQQQPHPDPPNRPTHRLKTAAPTRLPRQLQRHVQHAQAHSQLKAVVCRGRRRGRKNGHDTR